MLITGLPISAFRGIVRGVSESRYEGNVIIDDNTNELSPTRFRAKLRTKTGRGSGARTSWTGRHYPIACWHAYRDVLAEVFRQYPKARVQTMHAIYRGAADFRESYLPTGNINIGSMMEPVTMPELCQCAHEEAYAVIEPDQNVLELMVRLTQPYTTYHTNEQKESEPESDMPGTWHNPLFDNQCEAIY